MEITLRFVGFVEKIVGSERFQMTFPAGAAYQDLLKEIDRQFGDQLPERMWDRDKKCFKGPTLVVGEGRDLESPGDLLIDGEEIKLIVMMAGG